MKPAPDTSGRSSATFRAAPLFLATSLFCLGILAARWLWVRPPLLLLAIVLLAILAVSAALRALRLALLPLGFLFLLLGAWCAEMEPQPAPSPDLLSMSDDLLRTVEGTVIASAPVRDPALLDAEDSAGDSPTQSIDLRLATLEAIDDDGSRQVPISGIARLSVRWKNGDPRRIPCGERVRIVAQLLPPVSYHDPGVWSRTDFLLQQGVTATGTVRSERVERLGPHTGRSVACVLSEAQRAASAQLLSLPARMRSLPHAIRLSAEDAVMLNAMVTGDRTFLTHTLRVGFERTGSFHMLVVSGFHLAIVAGCLFWLAGLLRIPRIPATLFTIAASLLYALFTGFATPVQRSLWMVSLYLVARLFYRERNVLNTIGFASLCLLVVHPRAVWESSFQMTLLAVVSIGGIATPILQATLHPYLKATRHLRLLAIDPKLPPAIAQFRVTLRMIAASLHSVSSRWIGWTLSPVLLRFTLRVAEAVVVSFVIELAMTLPMAIYFHRITLAALPVNLLILPLLLLLMPAALLTLAALVAWPAIALIPASITALLLHIGVGMVHAFGSLQWGDLRIPTPLPWQTATFWFLLALAIALLARPRAGLRWAAVGALLLGGAVAVSRSMVEHPRDALLVQALDVGQGDSLLLVTPDGKTLLVDGGGRAGAQSRGPAQFDIGEEVVSAALWERGIRHLDAVALSHAHSDHMEGLTAVLRNFHPNELWVGNNPPAPEFIALLGEAQRWHTRVRPLHAGDAFTLGAVRVHTLAPTADYHPGATPANNDSLVLHVAYGNTSLLLAGDAEAPVEHAMLNNGDLSSTLLKVGHHGSITSTQPEFLAGVAPAWAIISCGLHNHYGHPRPEILSELEQAHVRTYTTDTNGAVCFRLDGQIVKPIACAAPN